MSCEGSVRHGSVAHAGGASARMPPRVLAGCVLFVSSLACGADSELDAYVELAMTQWAVPGLSVAVVRDGRVVLEKGYGTRELGGEVSVDEHTIFGIGSMTKSFTATAAAMLVDDGKLSWDDSVTRYLPEFRYHDPWITEHATVRDLASHRVGIDANFPWVIRDWSVDATLESVRYLESRARFGDYDYSNTGITALGRIVEIASGQSWETFIAKRIFEPLGMRNSNTHESAYVESRHLATCWLCTAPEGAAVGQRALRKERNNAASPHGLVEGGNAHPGDSRDIEVWPWRYEGSIAPAGAINSTAHDLAQWLVAHLQGGLAGRERLISAAQLRQIHAYQGLTDYPALEPKSDASPFEASNRVPGYGLGWGKRLYRGHLVSAHGGGQVGFGAMMWIVPEERLGVVVMQNVDFRQSLAYAAVARWIVDRRLGLEPLDWNAHEVRRWSEAHDQTMAALSPIETTSDPAAPGDAENYTGVFTNPALGEARVGVEGEALVLRFGPHSAADLRRIDEENFLAVFRGADKWRASVRFSRNATGTAGGFVFGETLGATQPFTFTRREQAAP